MKRYGKFIIFAIALFFTSALPCFAKKMNIEELEKELERIQPNAGYVYIIGEYVFTSEYTLDLSDVVLAADSMNNEGSKTDKTKVNIYQLLRVLDEDYNGVGLKKTTNALGKGELPENFDIRYIDYVHIGETTTANISVDVDDTKYSTYKNVLKNYLGFETKDFYSGKLKYENNKVTGLLLKKSVKDISYNEDDQKKFADAKYFFAYILEVPNATNDTVITRTKLDGTTSKVELSNFDVKIGDSDKTPGIVILTAIDPTKWEASSKKITITVDLDGNGDYYDPTDYTLDLSGISFQIDSSEKTSISETNQGVVTEADKNTFIHDWGYDSSLNSGIAFIADANNPLTFKAKEGGKLVEQTLYKGVYKEGEETGYYFDFTFVLNGNKDKKAVISSLKSPEIKTENINKTFKESEYDENGNLTILFRIDPSKNCSDGTCKAYYSVDLDGTGDKYLPVIYTIDYSNLTLEKASIFTVDALTNGNAFESTGWYDTADGYSVKVEKDSVDSSKYYVSGLLPIIEDGDWKNQKPEDFNSLSGLYYLGLKLTLINGIEGFDKESSTINVTFDHEQNQPSILSAKDFSSSKVLYLLKALKSTDQSGESLKKEDKYFTITVDLDGNADTYAPYTVTIDYSGLEFQYNSVYTNANVIQNVDTENQEDNGYISSSDKKDYQSWGYDFNNTGNNLNLKVEGGEYILSGEIKEQNVPGAKFASGAKGYYILVKIYGPTDENVKGSILEGKNNKWTVTLRDESGSYKAPITPSAEDYKNGFITVLFKLKDDDTKKFVYQIDWDGNENYFLPYEETIDYSGATLLSSHEVTFDDKDNATENPTTILWDGDTIEVPADFVPKAKDEYHEFAYWNKENGTSYNDLEFVNANDSDTEGKETGDVTLVPHWNLYSDKFIADVLKEINKSENFVIEDYDSNSGQVTLSVTKPEATVSTMNDTGIPGTIAYILLKDEIKSITLSASGQKHEFTKTKTSQDELKAEVQKAAKDLYTELLKNNFDNKTDEQVNISDLAQHETLKNFTLSLDLNKIDKTITLLETPAETGISLASENTAPTEYTFTFSSDAIVVDEEEDLTTALTEASGKEIIIAGDFNVESTATISGDVKINGGGSQHKITANNSAKSIFNITSGNVIIENIDLEVGESNESFEAGIEVHSGGNLTATNIKFDSEHYNKPLIKAEKTNTNISLTDIESKTALPIEKEIITPNDQGDDSKAKDANYNYYNYYNNPVNSKIYTTTINNHEAGYRLQYIKYNFYNEKIQKPNIDLYTKPFNYEGENYTLAGFSENRSDSILRDGAELPSSVITEENWKATADKSYWTSYTVKDLDGVAKVSSKEDFNAKLQDSSIHTIYIASGTTIDMSEEELNINKDLSIIGTSDGENRPVIKAKQIKTSTSANDVSFNRINLQIKAAENQTSLIEVEGSKLALWQCGLKNDSSNSVDYGIHYKNDKSIVDIRWIGTGGKGFDPSNLNKAYVYVEGGLAAGTNIFFNTFNKINDNASNIIVKKFNDDAKITEEDTKSDINYENNSYSSASGANKYAIKLEKDCSGNSADINISTSPDILIGVDWDENHKNFENIKLHTDIRKVKAKYIKETEESDVLTGGQGVSFVTEFVPGILEEVSQTVLEGIGQNEDGQYTGIIAQNSDGNFYLPLVITSSELKDRVSKINVIDPNGTSVNYLYSEYSDNGITPINLFQKLALIGLERESNAGVIRLNLEAIKESKITGENGKVYTIELDYNGDGNVESTTKIDYNSVKTEEEIILEAVQNTKNANSFTITKDNNIKGGIEKYTFKNDLENGNKYYSEGQDDSKIEQYSFRASSVGLDSDVIYVVEKSNKINAPIEGKQNLGERPKLNEWTYFNHFNSVSSGIQELGLLTDIVPENDGEFIDAIDTVSRGETEHTFNIKVNHVRLEKWLNGMYVDGKVLENGQEVTSESHDVDENSTITLVVTLDNDEKFITSIKTTSEFDIKSAAGTQYKNNKIDVKVADINNTEVSKPQELFATDNQGIQDFIAKGKDWWHKYTGSTSVN